MIKRITILAFAIALCFGAVKADINGISPEGCLERARAMFADGNYKGCADEIEAAYSDFLPPLLLQEAKLLEARAYVHIDRNVAATLLERFLAEHPASSHRAEAMFALGNCLYGPEYPQSYQRALDVYDSIDMGLLHWADQCDLAYRRAFCLIELAYGQPAGQAKEMYGRALKDLDFLAGNDKYGRASMFYKGYIAYAQGDYAKAESLLTPVRNFSAPCDMADFYLAQIAYIRGDWTKAGAMAKSLLQRPGIPEQYANEAMRLVGECAYRDGNDEEAKKYLRMYVSSVEVPQPSALYMLGIYEYRDGNYDESIRMLTPASELDDAMGQSACLYIGQAHLKQGDYDGAVLALDRAMDMPHDRSVREVAHYNFAVASLRGGKVPFGGAVSSFEDFIRMYPDSRYVPQAQEYVIDSYFKAENFDGALRSIEAMPRTTPETQKAKLMALYRLGAQALKRGDASAAIKYLSQTKALARYDAETAREATLLLGEAQYMDGKYASAAANAKEYLASAPRSAQNRGVAQVDLGYALFAQKKYAAAEKPFESAVSDGALANPIKADAACRLGDCLYYQKDFDEALKAYDRAYSLNPAVGDYALLQKALMEGYRRRHQAKIDYIKRLQREYPKSIYIPDALLEMTESYIQLGDNKSAIATYRKLVDEYPGTSQGRQGYLQMALTMLNSGNRQGAVDAYKDVVRKYPTSDEAAQGVEALKRIAAEDGWLAECADFINSVPGAPEFSLSEAEELEFESAEKAYIADGKPARLDEYVINYPQGAYRAKALSYLLQHSVNVSDDDAAYGYASALVDGYPDNGLALEAYAAKALIDQKRGKRTLALRSWQELAKKASTSYYIDMANMGIARNAVELSEFAVAEPAARAAANSADKEEALYLLGASLKGQGKNAEAKSAWEQAAENMDDFYGIRCAYELAQLAFDAGDTAQAETQAKAVANSNSEHAYWVARAFILLSDIYAAQGNDYKAQQYLKSLRDNYPGSDPDIFSLIDARLQ